VLGHGLTTTLVRYDNLVLTYNMSEGVEHTVRSIRVRLLVIAEDVRAAMKIDDDNQKRMKIDALRVDLSRPCATLMRLLTEFKIVNDRIERAGRKMTHEGVSVAQINRLKDIAFRLNLELSTIRAIGYECVQLYEVLNSATEGSSM